ncbi:DMT family transporter [Brevibacillus ginsengisoli]|uniref:DMT family transporter n=1 Tax=Brevibacillus ginsengisoli TaxID=363854 RepID=UPI003CE6FFC1
MPRGMYLALGLLSLIWGGSFFFIKVLLSHFGPWSIAFLRSGFGVLTILTIMFFMKQNFHFKRIPWKPMLIVGLFNTAIPWSLIAFSETRVTSSMASVLNATTPLWTMIIGVLFFSVKANRNQWLGMITGFAGILVLLDINPARIVSVDMVGFIAMLVATLCYGISSQVSKKYLVGLTMFQSALGTLLVCSVGSGIVAFSYEHISFVPFATDSTVWLALLGLGVLGSGVAYILFYHLIQAGSPEFASMVTYLVPGTAILWGFLILHETIHWTLLAGLVLILSGVFVAGRKPSNRRSQHLGTETR